MEQSLVERKPSQKAVNIFMITALVEVVGQVGIWTANLALYSKEIPPPFALFTFWQLTLLALTSIVAAIQLLKVYRANKDKTVDERNRALINLRNEPSRLRNLSLSVSLLVVTLFWSILAATSTNLGKSFVFHGLGLIIALGIICFNRLSIGQGTLPQRCDSRPQLAPSREPETTETKLEKVKRFFKNNPYVRNLIFVGVYVGFSLIYTYSTGIPAYSQLDWVNDPKGGAVFMVIGIAAMIVITALTGVIGQVTNKIHDKCIKEENLTQAYQA
jgi:hypothetical protein